MGSRKKTVVGYDYHFGSLMGVCRKSCDELVAIDVGDRRAWEGSVTENSTINIVRPDLFGGEDREGGIVATVDVMFGADDQPVNTRLQAMLAGMVSAWRGVTTLYANGLMVSGSAYPKAWSHRWRRTHRGWDGGVWYPEKARIELTGPAGEPIAAMNPAHILYQAYTDRDFGRSLARARLDDAVWRTAADQLHAEGFGLCLGWKRQDKISGFIQTVIDHIGAAVYTDPVSAKLVLKLVRDDYDVEALPLFTPDTGLLGIDDDDAGSQDTGINEVIVKYVSPIDGKDRSVRVSNAAAVHALGGVSSITREYPGVPTSSLALRLAQRDLRSLSGFIKRCKVRLDRRAFALQQGGVFRISDPANGIGNLVLRAGRVEQGEWGDGTITVTALQDVFGLPATSYVTPQGSAHQPPVLTPVAITGGRLIEVPYRDLAATLQPSDLVELTSTSAYVAALGAAPSSTTLGFELRTRVGASGAFAVAAEGGCTPAAVLTVDVDPWTTVVAIGNALALAKVSTGTAVLLDDEVCRLDAVDLTAMTVTLGRGCADTVPAAHAAGAVLLFYDGAAVGPDTEYATGVTLQGKLVTRTSAGKLAEADAPTLSVTFDSRAARPYPPQQLKVCGVLWPTAPIAADEVALSWVQRNRITQLDQLVDAAMATVAPESDTTYKVELRRVSDNVLVASAEVGNTSATFEAVDAGTYRALVWAKRGGLLSWQPESRTFTFDAPPARPQITQVEVGGSWSAGSVLTVLLGGVPFSYTTGAEATLAGAAAALASVIDADASYSASASGTTMTIVGQPRQPYSVSTSIGVGGMRVFTSVAQVAAPAGAGTCTVLFTNFTAINNNTPWSGAWANVPPGTVMRLTVHNWILGEAATAEVTLAADIAPGQHDRVVNSELWQRLAVALAPWNAGKAYLDQVLAYDKNVVGTALPTPPEWATGFGLGSPSYMIVFPRGKTVDPWPTGVASGSDYSVRLDYLSANGATLPLGWVFMPWAGTPALGAAQPQIGRVLVDGLPVAGAPARVTLGGVDFTYIAVAGDTYDDVAAGLAALIDAHAAYAAVVDTPAGVLYAIVKVTGPPGATWTMASGLVASAVTLTATITQKAA
ncbi:MAG: phage tail protein [Proteobacteria bacterium]|nr:phage tail protein [Pseudomonadota bacterium]